MDLGLNIYKQHESVDNEQTLGRISLNSSDMYKVMRLDGSENNAIPKKGQSNFWWVIG